MPDKEMLPIQGRTELDASRYHHFILNSTQFKIDELFISGIVHFLVSDCSWPQVTETSENLISGKGTTTVL